MKIPQLCAGLILSLPAVAFAIPANPGPVYEVDPAWPQKSADLPWAAVPSVAVDALDNVWVYVRTNPVLRIYAPDGSLKNTWREDGGHFTPHAVRFDREGNVWLVDNTLQIVRKYTREGSLLLTLGTKGVSGEDDRHFKLPTDIAFTPNGHIYVSDGYGNARVVHFDPYGHYLGAWGKRGSAPGDFNCPHSIISDSHGRLYVADRNNGRVQVFDGNGRVLAVWTDLIVPWTLSISAADEIWACGSSPDSWKPKQNYLSVPPKDQIFMKFNTDGKVLQLWTVPKGRDGAEQPGELNWVHGLAFDSHGNIYAGDIIGKRIQKFVKR